MSVYPDDGTDMQSLIQHADSAMYTVKTLGKHGVRRFESEIDAEIERLQMMERALLVALSQGQMRLVYQPICSLNDGVVRKLETLLRWMHPTLGAVSAAEFIPIAENNGQIIPIGAWVLRAACQQARRWNDETGLAVTVCVNVSPLQFAQPGFVASVREALQGADLPASALEIELTESAVMRRMDLVKAGVASPRGEDRHRRFRHRVFLVVVPERPSDQLHQDRQVLRPRPQYAQAGTSVRAGDH